jgi:hypothetical protein
MAFLLPSEVPFAERMLWMSVIRRAVYDFVLYKGVGQFRIDWQRANQYIFGAARPTNGMTFEEACHLFGWEPDYVRRLTKKLTRADIKQLEVNLMMEDLREVPPAARCPRWNSIGMPVPVLGTKHAAKSKVAGRVTSYRKHKTVVPMIQWQAAVA